MKIYTFHTSVPSHDMDGEIRLLNLWRQRWIDFGAEPVVLNEWHARQHPYYGEFAAAIAKLPTVNSAEYERACYIRHLALAYVEGGWMMDYDVFPKLGHTLPKFKSAQLAKLHLMQANCICPCMFYATTEVAERLCQEFASGRTGLRKMGERDHYSDQYSIVDLVEAKADWIVQHNRLLGYGDEGWGESEFVHFSNASTIQRGMTPRWKTIPELLK